MFNEMCNFLMKDFINLIGEIRHGTESAQISLNKVFHFNVVQNNSSI